MLQTYVAVFRNRASLLVLLTAVLAPVLFLALTARADVYRSDAILQVGAGNVAEEVLGQPRAYEEPGRRVATELEILTSAAVQQRAAQQLTNRGRQISDRELADRVQAAPRGVSNFIEVSGRDNNPVQARLLTQALVDSYIEYRSEAQRVELERVRDDLQNRLRTSEVELAALDARTGQDGGAAARERAAALARFETLNQLVEGVRLRLSVDTSGVRVLAMASTPDGPVNAVPPAAAVVLALLGALLLGSGALLLLSIVKDTVRTRDEADSLMPARTLVQLPRPHGMDGRWQRVLRQAEHPSAPAAGTLRLRLSGMSGGSLPSRILVTGTAADAEDCLWVASSLASACARAGTQVLVVADPAGAGESVFAPASGELRDPGEQGLPVSPTLLPGISWAPLSTDESGVQGLRDATGPAQQLDVLQDDFPVIILVAPVREVVEVVALSHLAAAAVAVCAIGRTRARRLRALLDGLESSGFPVSGMVLTTAPKRRSSAPARADDQQVTPDGAQQVVAADTAQAAVPAPLTDEPAATQAWRPTGDDAAAPARRPAGEDAFGAPPVTRPVTLVEPAGSAAASRLSETGSPAGTAEDVDAGSASQLGTPTAGWPDHCHRADVSSEEPPLTVPRADELSYARPAAQAWPDDTSDVPAAAP